MPVITRLDPTPEPLAALAAVSHLAHVAFLDGAAEPGGLGRWSYLAAEPVEILEGSAEEWPAAVVRIRETRIAVIPSEAPHRGAKSRDLLFDQQQIPPLRDRDAVAAVGMTGSLPPFRGGWIGWLSYELGRAFDRQPRPARDDFHIPDFSLARYENLIAWDHLNGECFSVGVGPLVEHVRRETRDVIRQFAHHCPEHCEQSQDTSHGSRLTSHVHRDFTPSAYIAAVQRVIDYVHAGDIFQANLSQRFTTPFTGDSLALYAALRRRAPGSHAAYLDRGRVRVLSMSPERFLQYDPVTRQVETRPIKGTRPRDQADTAHDTALAADLVTSDKDRAENVMIVDLLRNDLHRVSEPASVQVASLCRLETHAAVHHLVSVVTSTLAPEHDALDLIAATFPGGSITGAPKLRAMDIIAELEPVARGVYCGAIGWLGNDGALDLNIAIRTVTVVGGAAAVQAGGGITALSDPSAEYQESLDKAEALLDALAELS